MSSLGLDLYFTPYKNYPKDFVSLEPSVLGKVWLTANLRLHGSDLPKYHTRPNKLILSKAIINVENVCTGSRKFVLSHQANIFLCREIQIDVQNTRKVSYSQHSSHVTFLLLALYICKYYTILGPSYTSLNILAPPTPVSIY